MPQQNFANINHLEMEGYVIKLLLKRDTDGYESPKKFKFQYIQHLECNGMHMCPFCDFKVDDPIVINEMQQSKSKWSFLKDFPALNHTRRNVFSMQNAQRMKPKDPVHHYHPHLTLCTPQEHHPHISVKVHSLRNTRCLQRADLKLCSQVRRRKRSFKELSQMSFQKDSTLTMHFTIL